MADEKENKTVITEERVTKRVIRRRASVSATATPSTSPPVSSEVTPELEMKSEIKEAELHSQEPTSSSLEASSQKTHEPRSTISFTSQETITDVAQLSEPEQKEAIPTILTSPSGQEDSGYLAKYKRLKVLASQAPEPQSPMARKLATTSTPKNVPLAPGAVDSLLAAPGAIGLGRKEIIEIRDFRKPKVGRKKRLLPGKKGKKTEITIPKAAKRVIRISDTVTVSDLAKKMSVKAGEVIQKLLSMGMMVTINQSIDMDTASLVASEFSYEIENVALAPEDLLLAQEKEEDSSKPEDLKLRPPIVTVMGHVDHGKTTLLDTIRKTDVAGREAGGITQHIGAYTVKTESGRNVTFIDTPGHEAFTAMRARGARVTDLVVLVVAGDDGVMPQTKEAISHAQNANVPIIVAINKMDKPGANQDKIKKALTEFKMVPEEWGGDTIYVPVSAKMGDGIPQLLEFILLQSEVLELKANPKKLAKGIVLESSLDKRRGVVMTVLVQEGTLREGDVLLVGPQVGKVRAMRDDKGARIREAGPSSAVEVMGLAGVASAGDAFSVVADEKKAKQITELRQNIVRTQELAKTSKISLDDLYQKIEKGEVKELKIIIKADTAGSVEVLTDALQKLSTPKVAVRVIHGAVGGISENDVMLARASGALIVAFHLRSDAEVTALAEQQRVEIRTYEVIYELTEDMVKAMTGLLAPKKVEKTLGHAEVKQTFTIPKAGTVAGCSVKDGKILRSAHVRLIRDSVLVYTGQLKSLKRFKDDAKEVTTGLECGLAIENFNDIKVGDIIEAFLIEETTASLT